jgi:HSP20 family protein
MPIFRFGQSWDPFGDLEREVDRLLESVGVSLQGLRFGRQFPAINVYELGNELLLTAEVPGTRPDDLEVTVADGVLTLKGRRRQPDGVVDEQYRRQERLRGSWQRSIPLPERILEHQLSAEFSNGILKVHLPKAPMPPVRQIKVVETSEGTVPAVIDGAPLTPGATVIEGAAVVQRVPEPVREPSPPTDHLTVVRPFVGPESSSPIQPPPPG